MWHWVPVEHVSSFQGLSANLPDQHNNWHARYWAVHGVGDGHLSMNLVTEYKGSHVLGMC